MDYLVTLENEAEYLVALRETRRGLWETRLSDGEALQMELRGRTESGDYLVLVNGVLRRFAFREEEGALVIVDEDARIEASLQVARAAEVVLGAEGASRAGSARTGQATETSTVASPITGVVVDVLVSCGQLVAPGEPVIVVEAMKMENTLRAPHGARVSEIYVKPGETIFVQDALIALN